MYRYIYICKYILTCIYYMFVYEYKICVNKCTEQNADARLNSVRQALDKLLYKYVRINV